MKAFSIPPFTNHVASWQDILLEMAIHCSFWMVLRNFFVLPPCYNHVFWCKVPLLVIGANVTEPGSGIIPAWLSIVNHEYNHQLRWVIIWWEMLFLVVVSLQLAGCHLFCNILGLYIAQTSHENILNTSIY
jgi:hypothetical protein